VIERWDKSAQVTFDRRVLAELCTLRFIAAHRNVVVLGPVGVGKTFLASALGHLACRASFHVRRPTPYRDRRPRGELLVGQVQGRDLHDKERATTPHGSQGPVEILRDRGVLLPRGSPPNLFGQRVQQVVVTPLGTVPEIARPFGVVVLVLARSEVARNGFG
jgi:hypothetical protein